MLKRIGKIASLFGYADIRLFGDTYNSIAVQMPVAVAENDRRPKAIAGDDVGMAAGRWCFYSHATCQRLLAINRRSIMT